jgi:uncharacterized integral membrane protein
MLRLLKFLLLAPVAILLVMFGVANRQSVTLLLDPLTRDGTGPSITLPLFLFFFAVLTAGIVIGYVAAWFAQGKHRKAERHLKRECDRLSGECDKLKAQLPATATALLSRPQG